MKPLRHHHALMAVAQPAQNHTPISTVPNVAVSPALS